MTYERCDVVVALDPFKPGEEPPRPFLIISDAETPFHGEQYIVLSLTTKTWHDERIPLDTDDWLDGGAPESSSIMPWSVNSVRNEWIHYRQGTIRPETVTRAVAHLTEYID